MKTITTLFIFAVALTACAGNDVKSQNQTPVSTNQATSNSQNQTQKKHPTFFL